jgi:hypothetical protein
MNHEMADALEPVSFTFVPGPEDKIWDLYVCPDSHNPVSGGYLSPLTERFEVSRYEGTALDRDLGIIVGLEPSVDYLEWRQRQATRGPLIYVPAIVHDFLVALSASGVTAGLFRFLKIWVDTRNGRKLKIKVGEIEVEATQMAEKDVLQIFELLQEKADRAKIRALLVGKKD